MISHMGNETGCSSGKYPGGVGFSDVISHVGCLSVNTSHGMVHRLFICNKSCGLSKCKKDL